MCVLLLVRIKIKFLEIRIFAEIHKILKILNFVKFLMMDARKCFYFDKQNEIIRKREAGGKGRALNFRFNTKALNLESRDPGPSKWARP